MTQSQIIALMSGGIDSFVMTHKLTQQFQVLSLFVDYQQQAVQMEYKAVQQQVSYLPNIIDTITIRVEGLSPLLSNNLTRKEHDQDDFYPARNQMLLTFAAQVASAQGIGDIAIGINNSPRTFPDCQRPYFLALEQVLSTSTGSTVRIHTPLSPLRKREIMLLYADLNLPIDMVYSCQKGGRHMCFHCPSCLELQDAMEWVGISSTKN